MITTKLEPVDALKKIGVAFAILVSSLVLVAVFSFLFNPVSDPESFYVGVTYCGESVEEAKLLIDKVRNYTNVFCLQSGVLQHDPIAITEIGDYTVASGLNFISSFGSMSYWPMKTWLDTYDRHWGDQFLGVYFGDEPAGKMIDGEMSFFDEPSQSTLTKMADGSVTCSGAVNNGAENNFSSSMEYCSDGTVIITINDDNGEPSIIDDELNPDFTLIVTKFYYFPNGTITSMASELPNFFTSNESVDPSFGNETVTANLLDRYNMTFTYEGLMNTRPFQTYDEAAQRFIDECSFNLARYMPKQDYLTSDYVLHWFDYKAGYGTVLAQFGWNHTLAQDLALVRGAATLQNKTWGAILTWKYINPPYLDSGEKIYNQLCMAYKAGAQYVLLFNYAEDMQGPYGTLQEEHFIALEQFWNNVVNSSDVKHGSTKAEAVLVLPQNYGWAMRNLDDKIWGLWGPDEKSQQIWELSRDLLGQYGTGLDIVYDDPQFPVEGKYSQIYYWNQTG